MKRRRKGTVRGLPVEHGIRPHVFHMWADDLIIGIGMQAERLMANHLPPGTEDWDDKRLSAAIEDGTQRARIDFDLYFTLVRRLLRTADEAAREGYAVSELDQAILEFHKKVPGLVDVRDSGEHFDDWLRTGRTRSFGIGLGGGPDTSFWHGDDRFELGKVTEAAERLYAAIKEHVPGGAPEFPGPPLAPGDVERATREATWFPPTPGDAPRPDPDATAHAE